jgi:8-oxo-dGTP diphosphatase
MAEERKVGVGVGVMLLKGNKVLLGRRHGGPGNESGPLGGARTWSMPGGKLEFGESFEEAARRETLEEAGIRLRSMRVIGVNNDRAGTAHFVTIGLLSEEFDGEASVMEPGKMTEWGWFALDTLPEPLYLPSAKVLDNYLKTKFFLNR